MMYTAVCILELYVAAVAYLDSIGNGWEKGMNRRGAARIYGTRRANSAHRPCILVCDPLARRYVRCTAKSLNLDGSPISLP